MATSTKAATNGKAVETNEDDRPVAALEINKIATEIIEVPILGISPLICHRFSEKAKRAMLDAMQGRKTPKTPKDPAAEYEAAFYKFADGGYGIPIISFKAATVEASRFYGKDVTKVGLRQFIFMNGEIGVDAQMLARIEGEPRMQEDVVRVGRGGTDLRYRPYFDEWKTTLTVTYVTSALTQASVMSLIEAGGMGVGVGEWRPEKNGVNGQYRIDPNREITVLLNGAK